MGQELADAATVAASASPRRRPKDRKRQILLQARDLFVSNGYHSVSMAMIADGVGISPGALYRHYANKNVLLEAVVLDTFSDVGEVDGATLDETLDAASSEAVARPHVGVLWSREARYLSEETRTEVRQQMRRSAQGYIPLLQRQRPRLKPHHAELLAWGIQSVLTSPSRHAIRTTPEEHAAAIAASARALASAHLSSDDGTAARGNPGLMPVSRRERLLLAAMDLFSVAGYQETSMADIGAAADVTGQNLYGYFDNKADVLRAAIERGTHVLWIQLDEALAAHDNAADALAAVVAGYVRIAQRWAGLRVDLTGEGEIGAEARTYQREYVAEWAHLVSAARPEVGGTTARLLVQQALAVADDLGSTPHLVTQHSFTANVSSMVLAVLNADADH